jgi:hypothetical protein
VKVTMQDYEDYSFGQSQGYFSAGPWVGEGFRESCYRSPHGIVEIYEQLGKRPIVSMRFIHQGQCRMRRWDTSWGDKTIARLAREFVESVVA